MFTPTLRCECAQPASDRLMRKWCILYYHFFGYSKYPPQLAGKALIA